MFRKIPMLSICAVLLLGACGTARVVRRTQTGGVLALEGERNKAMEQANQMMMQHCQGPYTIVEEGEHVVGTETSHSDESYVTEEGTVVNEGGEVTREATEWRIRYVCGASAAPPPQGPPGGYPEQGPAQGPPGGEAYPEQGPPGDEAYPEEPPPPPPDY